MPAMIVLGDRTDHGGEVIEASGLTDTHGKRIARVGDRVSCPKKGHGNAVIVTGDHTMTIDGKAVAFHGCKTSCGAVLISAQAVTTVEAGGGAGTASSRATTAIAPAAAKEHLPFDEQFRVVDPVSGTPLQGLAYFIRTSSGATYAGFTDGSGMAPRVSTERAETLQVWFGIAALRMENARHG